MNIQVNLFTLEGCQCRLKFDPRELQELLRCELRKKLDKKAKHFQRADGDLVISGVFEKIDEGNFALHLMLAFLGRARVTCRVTVTRDGRRILDEVLSVSATCSCFTGGRSQLRYDTQVVADKVVKKTIKALNSRA